MALLFLLQNKLQGGGKWGIAGLPLKEVALA